VFKQIIVFDALVAKVKNHNATHLIIFVSTCI